MSLTKRPRKYHHLTCSNCRRRKTKCDGTVPVCATCKGFGDVNCTYDKPASIAYVRHLEKQVQKLTNELENSETGEKELITADIHQLKLPPHNEPYLPSSFGITDQELAFLTKANPCISSLDKFSQKRYLTNFSTIAAKIENYALSMALTGPLATVGFEMAKRLLSYFWSWVHPHHMHIYRPMFFSHMVSYDPTSRSHPSELCYSPALLCMILAESARTLSGPDSELYRELDRYGYNYLVQDLGKTTTVATMCSSILYSTRSMDRGNISTSWIFSGVAIRMSAELSIETAPEQLNRAKVPVEEAELRRRLSCFMRNFDQVVSLCHDREPTYQKAISSSKYNNNSPEEALADDTFDSSIWDPSIEIRGDNPVKFGATMNEDCINNIAGRPTAGASLCDCENGNGKKNRQQQPLYQSMSPGYYLACFKWQSKLTNLLREIITRMRGDIRHMVRAPGPGCSSTGKDSDQEFTVFGMIQKLEKFWDTVPEILKLRSSNDPTVPHVISFNFSYHVCFVLLLLPIFQQVDPSLIENELIMQSIKAGSAIRVCLEGHFNQFGTECTSFWHTYSPYLVYQLLQVSLTEFTDRPQEEFDHATVLSKFRFLHS